MKVLVPYDGTRNADDALHDLQFAGLAKSDEIMIVITDVWLPESVDDVLKARNQRRLNLERSGTSSYAPAQRRVEEERFLSNLIRNRLGSGFPEWNIKYETLRGSSLVSSEVLEKTERWNPDLIILGSQQLKIETPNKPYRSGLWRVVSEADCSVRLARRANSGRSVTTPGSPSKIIAILNGPKTDGKIVSAVGDRRWTVETELRLLKVSGNIVPEKQELTLPYTTVEPFKLRLPNYVNASAAGNGSFKFKERTNLIEIPGLRISRASLETYAEPDSIMQAIRDWNPDCIFICDSTSSTEKRVSGGLATSNDITRMILNRAPCSAEIVRSTEILEQKFMLAPRPSASIKQLGMKNIATVGVTSF